MLLRLITFENRVGAEGISKARGWSQSKKNRLLNTDSISNSILPDSVMPCMERARLPSWNMDSELFLVSSSFFRAYRCSLSAYSQE